MDKVRAAFPARGSWLLPVAAYSIAMLFLLSPLLLKLTEAKWDAMDQFLPAFTYLADSLREGRFPLWDPYTNCGFPYHAEPQNLTLHPLALILALLAPTPTLAFNLFWVLNWWWGGLGMMWVAREHGASPAGGFAAAIAYALSGFQLGHAEHTSYLIVAAWLPWVFGCAERAVARSCPGWAVLAGVALGIASYGGYPGMILFSCLALGLWLLARFLRGAAPEPAAAQPALSLLLRIALTLAIMAAMLSAVWSPVLHAFFAEGAGYTDRVGQLAPDAANLGDPFTFSAALSFFFPYLTIVAPSEMGADISMTNGYLGILSIPFALFWATKAGPRRSAWLLAFALFMFAVSLGGQYGLRTLLYYLYPPLRFMRFSAPFRLFWIFPLCLAAGLGVSTFLKNEQGRNLLYGLLAVWAGAACCVAVLALRMAGDEPLRLLLPAAPILLVAGVLFLVLARHQNRTLERVLPVALSVLMLADMSAHLYNNAFTVWNANQVTRLIDSQHVGSTTVMGAPGARFKGKPFNSLNAQQIIKVPMVEGYTTMLSKGFNETLCQSRFVELLGGPLRFWLTPGTEPVPSPAEALAALASTGSGSAVPAFVAGAPQPAAARVVPGSYGRAEIRKYAPERVELSVEVPGTGGALLASTERHAAGWRVEVDGVPQRVEKVNLFFRGVLVGPGTHTVTWLYQPRLWKALVWLSYLTLTAGLLFAILRLRRDRRREEAEPSRPKLAGEFSAHPDL